MIIKEIELSQRYLIAQRNISFDYVDVFQLTTQSSEPAPEPKACMLAFFRSFSPLVSALLISRETLVEKLGLKTAEKLTAVERKKHLDHFKGNIGDSIAIFEVLDKSDIELLTGQTDKHLDFQLSFISYEKEGSIIIELATTVKHHNIFGHIYFFFVKPFHRWIMKRILKRMGRVLFSEKKQVKTL